jgi:hypothetical protein
VPLDTAKAVSVTKDSQPDGWEPTAGFVRDLAPDGQTQLVASVPTRHLLALHVELVRVLSAPLGLMYRQVIDRRDPKPQGTPPRDFVALELSTDAVVDALRRFTDLIHHDARCELWVRGALGDHVVLDTDGLLHCAPDDPAFRDVLLGNGLVEDVDETIADRDYVMHQFHAENDALEDALLADLGLTEYVARRL